GQSRTTLPSTSRCRLESRRFGLALRAEPALATYLLDAAALVVGRPRQQVDALAACYETLDGAAVGSAALRLLPGLGTELARALGLTRGPDAGLGVARRALEPGVAGEEAAAREHLTLAHQLAVDLELAPRADGERMSCAIGTARRAGDRAST